MAARLLSKFVMRTPHGLGLGSPWAMQLAIDEAGLPRVLGASAIGLAGKLIRRRGWFYRVAGHHVNDINGPTEYSAYPSNLSAKMAPKDSGSGVDRPPADDPAVAPRRRPADLRRRGADRRQRPGPADPPAGHRPAELLLRRSRRRQPDGPGPPAHPDRAGTAHRLTRHATPPAAMVARAPNMHASAADPDICGYVRRQDVSAACFARTSRPRCGRVRRRPGLGVCRQPTQGSERGVEVGGLPHRR